eukprot:m.312345 g.312345  ORF g.312345 m.312345 type:complete len:231 (+) comp253193_c0_seq1:111-803(+)
MKGYLATQGFHGIGQGRIGKKWLLSTTSVAKQLQSEVSIRCHILPNILDKLHWDQNEKLGMYGVTHVAARDGFSGKVLGSATMPLKNNQVIYDRIYRLVTLKYSLWDQLRVDHGSEFLLILYVQESLAEFRGNTERQCYFRSESKHNYPIERLWGEVNQRVNYPIQAGLNALVEQDKLEMGNETSKFSVSSVAIDVCNVGMDIFIESWKRLEQTSDIRCMIMALTNYTLH